MLRREGAAESPMHSVVISPGIIVYLIDCLMDLDGPCSNAHVNKACLLLWSPNSERLRSSFGISFVKSDRS